MAAKILIVVLCTVAWFTLLGFNDFCTVDSISSQVEEVRMLWLAASAK
jgi:hypothetical protein